MVTTNPVNLARMDDERRKKASMEKAKAAHLSKQLQLRLQYARLKVDYGWQRQNLNEVENLYFHHSSQKGRLKPPLPRPHAKPAPGPPPISYPAPVHSTPHIVDVNMFQHQKEDPSPSTPLLPSAPTPGSSFTSSQASTAETHVGPASQASGSGSGSGAEASDCTMRPPPDVPAPAEPSLSSTPAPDQVMLSPFAPPPHPPPDALSPSPFAPPPSPFVPSLYTHAAAPPNPGPPPPNPGQSAQAAQPMYGAQPPATHTIPSAQALPAAYKTFDVATAAGGGGAGAPLTYDSFWSSHSSVGGWRRHMGRGGAAATG